MDLKKIIALAFIIIGIAGLAYGGFSYTKETHETNIGPLKLSVKEEQRVNIPLSLGIGFIVLGGVLLAVRIKP